MVRNHVAQRAGRVVEAAAMTDRELFVHGNLNMVDVIAIPDRLEHAVGKTQYQDVLYRLLAEIMIDPIELVLIGDFQQFIVQGFGRGEIGAERLFDHQPPPVAVVLAQQTCAPELAGDRREGVGGCCQIEQPISSSRAIFLRVFELLAHTVERGGVGRIGFDAGETPEELLRDVVADRAGGKLP